MATRRKNLLFDVAAKETIMNADYLGAADSFASSREQFVHGQQVVQEVPAYLKIFFAALPTGSQLTTGQHLLSAAESLSQAGKQIS